MQDKKRARIEKSFLSFFTLKSQLAIKIFLVQTPPKIVHAQYCSKSLKKGQKQECMCNYLPMFWKFFFQSADIRDPFLQTTEKNIAIPPKIYSFFQNKKIKGTMNVCSPI